MQTRRTVLSRWPELLTLALALTLLGCDDGSDSDPDLDPGMGAEQEGAGGGMGDPDPGMMTPDAEVPMDDAEVDEPPPLSSIEGPGPYGVGFQIDHIEYVPRRQTESRPLRVTMWYPTEDLEGMPAIYAGLLDTDGVFEGASVAIDEPAPVMIFSHGNGGIAEQNFFMAEFFASHGWIFVSLDHTGNTVREANAFSLEGLLDFFELRPLDVSATLDYVFDLPDDHPLQGLLSDQVAMSGHSFGGYTTLALVGAKADVDTLTNACNLGGPTLCTWLEENADIIEAGFHDDRIKAAIPLAPLAGLIFGRGAGEVTTPTLLMTGARDATTPNSREGNPLWRNLPTGENIRLDFPNAGHFTFSNACDLTEEFGVSVGVNDGCSPAFLDPGTAYDLINAYSLAFARYHLLGLEDDADLLTGDRTLAEDDIVKVSTK